MNKVRRNGYTVMPSQYNARKDISHTFLLQILNFNQSKSLVEIMVGETGHDTSKSLFIGKRRNLDAYIDDFQLKDFETRILKKKNTEAKDSFDTEDVELKQLKEKDQSLFDKYISLLSRVNGLKDENEKLKLQAYKSYKDLEEEISYEISSVTMEKDSLLILMELRENKKLKYVELKDKITAPEKLFTRLADLCRINFVVIDEKNGENENFYITPKCIEFLKKRGI